MKELAHSNDKMMSVQPIAYSQTCEIELVGSISNRQQYDGVTKTFSPDFGIRPCVMMPRCGLIDPDKPTATGDCNKTLDSFVWTEVIDGVQTIVASSEKASLVNGYTAVLEGDSRGQLTISKNSAIGKHRTLRFKATWIDAASGYVYTFVKEKALYLEDVTEAVAEIMLDVSPTIQWNPMRSNRTQKIAVSIMVGATDKTEDANTSIWWYRILDDGTRELVSSADGCWEITDAETAENGQITAITVDCDMIGDGIGYEVRACYTYGGDLPTAPKESDARESVKIARVIPALTAKFAGSGLLAAADTTAVMCQAIVSDNQGVIDADTWQKYIRARWDKITYGQSTNNGVVTMTESKETMGYGETFLFPLAVKKAIRLVLEDRGPNYALVDDSGNVLTDGDGNALVTRDV